jgi:hypothetical protein
VRDEVKFRCDNNIAAVGTERYRWMEAHPPGYYFLKYYRYMEKYGAVCIGSQYTSNNHAQLETAAGREHRRTALHQRGRELRHHTAGRRHLGPVRYIRPGYTPLICAWKTSRTS